MTRLDRPEDSSSQKNGSQGNVAGMMSLNKKTKTFRKYVTIAVVLALLACLAGGIFVVHSAFKFQMERLAETEIPSWIDQQIIDIDGHSRNGTKMTEVNDIVIHYVGNPGSTAQQNHDYYCNENSHVSSHFIVGLNGEIIQCIPLDEESAASNWRNPDTISVEVCHPDETGKFNDYTYESLVKLTSWLCERCKLDEKHVIRHYDVTGKRCPRYFVDYPEAWEKFKIDVKDYKE